MQDKTNPIPVKKQRHERITIQTRLILGAGIILVLVSLIIAIGYWNLRNAWQSMLAISLIAVLAFGIVVVGVVYLVRKIVKPITQLRKTTDEIKQGNLKQRVTVQGSAEVVDLAESINTLVEQLNQTLAELDQRVASRTSELEDHLNQLRVAAEMARDAASARGLDDLLYRSVNLIRDRFEFYYVSIFLLDDRSEYAILRAATGEAGRAMLESNLKIKVGEMDIVGQVSKTGQSRNNLIMETATIQMKNPTLPEARSEMGLPLKVGQRVIGVLDIQSREPSAFDEGDVNIIQTLADQLAVTIENARLYKESQDNLRQLESYYGRYSQEAWQRLGYFSSVIGYQYDRSGVKPIKSGENVDTVTDEQTPSTQMISYPLQVRGQVIGNLDIWPNKEDWSPKDDTLIEAISERISQAMESARLFEEAQVRATREQTFNQIVSRFSRSLDLDTLLQTAVKELGKLPDVVEASIHISPAEITHSGNGSKESPQ